MPTWFGPWAAVSRSPDGTENARGRRIRAGCGGRGWPERPGMTTAQKPDRLFSVWDPLNHERDEAEVFEAWSPLDAAECFANHDRDGRTDGLYSDGHPIAVEDSTGEVFVYEVSWVEQPESWREELGEGASLRAVRLVTGPEREAYLAGSGFPKALAEPSMRAELVAALEVDGERGIWLWGDLLEYARRLRDVAARAKVEPGDIEHAGVTLAMFDAWVGSHVEEFGKDWQRIDTRADSIVWRTEGDGRLVVWSADPRSLATAINRLAKGIDRVPHDLLSAMAAMEGNNG